MSKLEFSYQALFAETTSAEIRVAQYQLMLRQQYVQFDYFKSNNYLSFALNAIVYMVNHLMVFIGDMMSFLSLNTVNKQLKSDIKPKSDEKPSPMLAKEKVLLAKDCLNKMFPNSQSHEEEEVTEKEAEQSLMDYIDTGYVVPSPFATR